MDQRITALAQKVVANSIKVQVGDNVLIEGVGIHTFEFVEALVTAVSQAGGNVFIRLYDNLINRVLLNATTEAQAKLDQEFDLAFMKRMQCYVSVRGNENLLETSDVDSVKKAISNRYDSVVTEQRCSHSRWLVLRWPNPTFAQNAKMSTRAFEDFFFASCLYDYSQLEKNLIPLKELMERTNNVRINGKNVDLVFSIKDIPAIICAGEKNIPDGEIFTAPIKDSIHGYIHFNTPTLYESQFFDGIQFNIHAGKIYEAKCEIGDSKKLNEILDTDEGARYFGEFALGVNNSITQPMLDVLFDEKIGGSFHITPGGAYDDADNGNKSEIHWDMVMRQTPDHGGGEIYFDGVLIRKDGKFTLPELFPLNP